MQLTSAPLFVIAALIWGSTFYAIKFQLGEVSPVWSVSYRFLLAGAVLLLFAKLRGLNLRFSARQHRWMLLQGIFLFGLNYWLVYTAEQELTSALAAIAFATIIFLNIFFGRVFLGKAAEKKVILGALLGIAGTILLFQHDLSELTWDELPLLHIVPIQMVILVEIKTWRDRQFDETTGGYRSQKSDHASVIIGKTRVQRRSLPDVFDGCLSIGVLECQQWH